MLSISLRKANKTTRIEFDFGLKFNLVASLLFLDPDSISSGGDSGYFKEMEHLMKCNLKCDCQRSDPFVFA